MAETLTLIQAIARQEGFGASPHNIPTRNNNPGDIEYGEFAAAHGATGTDPVYPRYAAFPDAETGWSALRALLNDAYLGMTLEAALNKYAPPVENETNIYLANVCKWTGMEPAT